MLKTHIILVNQLYHQRALIKIWNQIWNQNKPEVSDLNQELKDLVHCKYLSDNLESSLELENLSQIYHLQRGLLA